MAFFHVQLFCPNNLLCDVVALLDFLLNLRQMCICMISVPHHTTPHHTITPHHTTPHHTTPHHTTPHHTTPHHTTPHHTTPHHTTPHHTYVVWCRLTRLSEGHQGRVLLHPSCQVCWNQKGHQEAGPIHWMIARSQAALQVQVKKSRWGIGPGYGMLAETCRNIGGFFFLKVQKKAGKCVFCKTSIVSKCNSVTTASLGSPV